MQGVHFTKREKIIFILTIFVFIVYVGYSVGYMPLYRKNKAVYEKIISANRQLFKMKRVIERAQALSEDDQHRMESFKQTVSNDRVMSSVLSEIEAVAKNRQILIKTMKPQRMQVLPASEHALPSLTVHAFSVSLLIEGSFDEIVHLIFSLEKAPHYLDVDLLKLKLISPKSNKLQCHFDVIKKLVSE